MNILFLFQKFSYDSSTIYLDLVKECVKSGHRVFLVAGTSEDKKIDELVPQELEGGFVVKTAYVRLPDQFKANKIKKGLVQLFIGKAFIKSIKKHLWNENIDLIAYPTPPITLADVVKEAKEHYRAASYLMLKDIFPQNAVDLGMMKENSLLHKYFKNMEKRLYENSDFIGCMSPANVKYMKNHLPAGMHGRIELFPNSVEILPRKEITLGLDEKVDKEGRVWFVLGGNIGKPQDIDFLLVAIECLKDYDKAEFLIIGEGTESVRLEEYIKNNKLKHVSYKKSLPRREYEALIAQMDVGIISLSSRFTIPNFPSRILSYMQMEKPVLVVSDKVSDMGQIVENEAKCGFYTVAGDAIGFVETIKKICENPGVLPEMGKRGWEYLNREYDVKKSVMLLESAYERRPIAGFDEKGKRRG